MDRVIITGGNGFIGKHLVEKFLTCKLLSLAVISNLHNIKDNFLSNKRFVEDSRLRFYTADIRDEKAIKDIFVNEKADTCIHLAAKISVADSIRNPDETMETNVKGTENVLEASYISKVKNFVFASSAAIYGDVRELPISEESELKPLSPYGTSKMLAEQIVLNYNRLKKIQNTASLRIFNVYGNGNDSQNDVISRFAQRLSDGLSPIIYGDGNHTRDFVSVDDVTDSMLLSVKAMENEENDIHSSTPVFNIGSGNGTSINDIAKKMIALSGLELEPIYKKGNQESGVILHSYADITRAKNILQFTAKKNLEQGLAEIINHANF